MYGWMTVNEIIGFVAPFYGTWDHDLAYKYVREFELPLGTKIKHLSKGQNVRLGLLLALAHRPEVVILDDPILGLDPVMRKQFNRDLITHLQGEGRTVFYSSHLLYEVEPVADEVAILDGGRIVRQADTDTLRRDVKQFVLNQAALAAVREDFALLDIQTIRRRRGCHRRKRLRDRGLAAARGPAAPRRGFEPGRNFHRVRRRPARRRIPRRVHQRAGRPK